MEAMAKLWFPQKKMKWGGYKSSFRLLKGKTIWFRETGWDAGGKREGEHIREFSSYPFRVADLKNFTQNFP